MEKRHYITIENYLEQLGFASPPEPTLGNFALLQQRHTAVFPFQTLTTLMKQPVSLDWADLEQKILVSRQGGYCYELNLLFSYLLSVLGYEATIVSGFVVHDTKIREHSARTHILVKVVLDGEAYIADVGHGGFTPTAPLRIGTTDIQITPHGNCSIWQREGFYFLRMQIQDRWRILYGFDLQPQYQADLEVGNWYVSTHPKSFFRSTLMVARTDKGGQRHALLNNRYTLHTAGRPSVRQELHNADEIIEVIQNTFGLRIADRQMARAAIGKLFEVEAEKKVL